YFWDANAAPGTYAITARLIEDGSAKATTTSRFAVPVATIDQAPVIDPVAPQSVQQAQTLTFQVTGSDPDGDAIAWSLVDGPAGATFDASSATFTWTPTFSDLGAYHATIRASDGQLSTDTRVPITIVLTPRDPTVANVPQQT